MNGIRTRLIEGERGLRPVYDAEYAGQCVRFTSLKLARRWLRRRRKEIAAMKKNEIKIGSCYQAKVGGRIVTVRIDSTNTHGGWNATNTATGKRIRIKSAPRLRCEVTPGRKAAVAKAIAAADQANARLRDERSAAADGMTASERVMSKSADAKTCANGCGRPATRRLKGRDVCEECLKRADAERLANASRPPAGQTPGEQGIAAAKADATAAKPQVNPTVEVITGQPIPADAQPAPRKPAKAKTAHKSAAAKKASAKKPGAQTVEKKPRAPKPAAEPKPKRLSMLDAAAQVLRDAAAPIRCKELIETIAARGLWFSPNGKTPEATLYAAMLREISNKGLQARFHKVDRGLFESNPAAAKA